MPIKFLNQQCPSGTPLHLTPVLIDLDPKKRIVEWDKTGFNPLNDRHVAHFITNSVA
jgi:hypothetical protein